MRANSTRTVHSRLHPGYRLALNRTSQQAAYEIALQGEEDQLWDCYGHKCNRGEHRPVLAAGTDHIHQTLDQI